MSYYTFYGEEDLEEQHKNWTQEPSNIADMRTILKFVPKDIDSVLDYGCGSGRYSQHFDNYVGFDRNLLWVDFAKKTYPDKTFCSELPKRNFDIVLLVSVIQYQPEDELKSFIDDFMGKSKKYVLIQTWDEDGPTKSVGGFKGCTAYRRDKNIYFSLMSHYGKVNRHVLNDDNMVVYLVTKPLL